MKGHRRASEYVVSSTAVAPDDSLSVDEGWIDMEVRWLITAETVGSERTVVGRTVLQPGSRHDVHRHPNAEEWEYVLSGSAIKHIGNESVSLKEGDIVFVPANMDHGLENASGTDVVVTIWGYSGAATLEAAGYELPSAQV